MFVESRKMKSIHVSSFSPGIYKAPTKCVLYFREREADM